MDTGDLECWVVGEKGEVPKMPKVHLSWKCLKLWIALAVQAFSFLPKAVQLLIPMS